MPVPDDDLAHQERIWMVERIGWVVMGVVIMAALAGAFAAGGPLGDAETGDPDGLVAVEYQRLQRSSVAATLRLRVDGKALVGGEALPVHVNQEFLDAVRLRGIVPEPIEWSAGNAGTILKFRIDPEGGPATFLVFYEPLRAGTVRIRLAVGELAPVEFAQFVYP